MSEHFLTNFLSFKGGFGVFKNVVKVLRTYLRTPSYGDEWDMYPREAYADGRTMDPLGEIQIAVPRTDAQHDKSIQKDLTTMFEFSKHPHQRELIVAEFINSFELWLNKLSVEPHQIIEAWLDECMHLNEKILFLQNDKILEGIFCGLNDNGFAKIKINNKVKSYNSINLI